jgi:hypothetical protein
MRAACTSDFTVIHLTFKGHWPCTCSRSSHQRKPPLLNPHLSPSTRMIPSIARSTLLLRHLRPPSPFATSTSTRNFVRNMSHSLYIDETPAEVKNAKVPRFSNFPARQALNIELTSCPRGFISSLKVHLMARKFKSC